MAEVLWCDYSYARPDVTPYAGVMRYLDDGNPNTSRPDLTAVEVGALHGKGKPIGLIWQMNGDKGRSGKGFDVGVLDAQTANAKADALGAPASVAVFYTVDWDAQPSQVEPYVRGVLSVTGRPVGLYGSARIVDWATSLGIAYRWQTKAWSLGVISPNAHLYQRDFLTDLDQSVFYKPFPAWTPKEAPVICDDLRLAWGAAPSSNPVKSTVPRDHFFSHYYGDTKLIANLLPDHAKCLALVKAIQSDHQNNRGWADIGYHGLTCPHGRSIEGRGVDYVGAHCPGYNSSGWGWMFLAGTGETPPDAMYRRQRAVYDELVRTYGRPLTKKGHMDGVATACPGTIIQAWVRAGMPAPALPAEEPEVTEETAQKILAALASLETKTAKVESDLAAVASSVSKVGPLVTSTSEDEVQQLQGYLAGLAASTQLAAAAGVQTALKGFAINTTVAFPTDNA